MAKKVKKTELEEFQDSFIREVDEDLKNDNLQQFWKKYGLLIIVAVVLIVSVTVSFETLKALREKKNQAWSDRYEQALNLQVQGEYDASLKVLDDIIAGKHKIYSSLAKVQHANVLFEQGDSEEAVKELEKIVSDMNVNESLRDVTAVKLAMYKFDFATRDELNSLLNPLVAKEGAWSAVAKEILAMLEVREGNVEAAEKLYQEILTTPNLPEGFRYRVQDMLSMLKDAE